MEKWTRCASREARHRSEAGPAGRGGFRDSEKLSWSLAFTREGLGWGGGWALDLEKADWVPMRTVMLSLALAEGKG